MTRFLFGESQCMRELERRAAGAAASDMPVLIEGETGTGKEALARHLHARPDGTGRFVRLYCGQPETREGFWEGIRSGRAGTVFLKHVHLLDEAKQRELLWALRADGDKPAGMRVIASSNESLERRVAQGDFSADLYFRLSACRLPLPPLRQRAEDIPALFAELLAGFGRHAGDMGPEIRQALKSYFWPGNFRELESVARHHATAADLEGVAEELRRRGETLRGMRTRETDQPPLREQVRRAARRVESEIILRTLEQHHWNRRRAARTLKISYRALLYKMKAFELRSNAWEGAE